MKCTKDLVYEVHKLKLTSSELAKFCLRV